MSWDTKVKEFISLFLAVPFAFVGLALPVLWRSAAWTIAAVLLIYWCLAHFFPNLRKKFLVTGVAALLGFSFAFPFIRTGWKHEKASSTTGVLRPSGRGEGTGVTIRIGVPSHLGATFTTPDSVPKLDFLKAFGDVLSVRREDGDLKLSTTVRDTNGNTIVSIVDNQWTVFPQFSVDKNYTSDSLEVKDSRGRVVLQTHILPDMVTIQGEWHDERHWNFRVADIVENGKFVTEILTYTATSPTYDYSIPAEFVYPSEDHWREFSQPSVTSQAAIPVQ